MLRCVLLFVCILSALSQDLSNCKNGITSGWLTIKDNGTPMNVTLTAGAWPEGQTAAGNNVTVNLYGNAQLAVGCHANFTPDMYKMFYLVGRTVSWTSDLSQAGCGCNASPFFSAFPAYGPDNKPFPGQHGTYTCAAPSDPPCPEFDPMEANVAAIQTTGHICDIPQGKHYPKCVTGGCGMNTHSQPDNRTAFGSGSSFAIDTTKPFRTSVKFVATGGVLTEVQTIMTQEGSKGYTMTMNNSTCQSTGPNYLKTMGEQMMANGMGMTVCFWSGNSGYDMSWLDVPPCDPKVPVCPRSSKVVFSDFEFTDN